jgi:hypothetical protein
MLSDLNQVLPIKEIASQTFRIEDSNNNSTKVDSRRMVRPNFIDSCGDSSLVLSARPMLSPKPSNITEIEKFKQISRSNVS